MTNRLFFLAGALALAAGSLACTTDSSVDLGHAQGSVLTDYAADWIGYAEAFQFDLQNTPTDRVHVHLTGDGHGWLQVGSGPPVPPPTDPMRSYPVGAKFSDDFYAGVAYDLQNVRIEDDRIRFDIDRWSPFGPWCALQTPYPAPGDIYYCVPIPVRGGDDGSNCTADYPDGTKVIECTFFPQCLRACMCDATGCTGAHAKPEEIVPVDAALGGTGTTLVGTMVLGASRVTLRLTRQ